LAEWRSAVISNFRLRDHISEDQPSTQGAGGRDRQIARSQSNDEGPGASKEAAPDSQVDVLASVQRPLGLARIDWLRNGPWHGLQAIEYAVWHRVSGSEWPHRAR